MLNGLNTYYKTLQYSILQVMSAAVHLSQCYLYFLQNSKFDSSVCLSRLFKMMGGVHVFCNVISCQDLRKSLWYMDLIFFAWYFNTGNRIFLNRWNVVRWKSSMRCEGVLHMFVSFLVFNNFTLRMLAGGSWRNGPIIFSHFWFVFIAYIKVVRSIPIPPYVWTDLSFRKEFWLASMSLSSSSIIDDVWLEDRVAVFVLIVSTCALSQQQRSDTVDQVCSVVTLIGIFNCMAYMW